MFTGLGGIHAPHSDPKVELAEIEKEEIDAYYGCFVPLRRTSDIRGIRPEDALDESDLPMATATTDEMLHFTAKPMAQDQEARS